MLINLYDMVKKIAFALVFFTVSLSSIKLNAAAGYLL